MKVVQRLAIGYFRAKIILISMFSMKKAAASAIHLFSTPPSRQIKEIPLLFQQAENLQFSYSRYQITGYRWKKNNAPRVLIVHGFESASINFAGFVQPLLDKGYEVLAFDAPAHGRSSGKTVNALIYKEFIQFVQEKFGPYQAYIGHSLGGLALSMAVAEAEQDEKVRLVLIAPVTETPTIIDQFFQTLGWRNRELRRAFDEKIVELSGHSPEWFSMTRVIPILKARILWLHDEEDTITPWSYARKIMESNPPRVKFVVTRGLGHRRIYRDPEIGKTIVDFL